MKKLEVDENTSISMPARNLLTIIGSLLVGAWFGFGVIERLNSIETQLQLMEKDIEAANTFVNQAELYGVRKNAMAYPANAINLPATQQSGQIQNSPSAAQQATEFLTGDNTRRNQAISLPPGVTIKTK